MFISRINAGGFLNTVMLIRKNIARGEQIWGDGAVMRLEIRNVSYQYKKEDRMILENFNLSVEHTERVGLAAPSGYGKTTLCMLLSGYLQPDSGEILLDGKPLHSYRGYCPVQMIWQQPELAVNPRLRMRDVILEGDQVEEFDVEISMNDIRKDIFCASGPGGQSVNTTYSAIRLTHIPTGIVVQCQDQKSQLKNFDKAFEELRTRVFNLEYSKYLDEIASKRKTMVSTGDRSAKIRTYNYPQGRITDHRINYTIYNLSAFMDGDIQDVIDHLIVAENAERLKESEL